MRADSRGAARLPLALSVRVLGRCLTCCGGCASAGRAAAASGAGAVTRRGCFRWSGLLCLLGVRGGLAVCSCCAGLLLAAGAGSGRSCCGRRCLCLRSVWCCCGWCWCWLPAFAAGLGVGSAAVVGCCVGAGGGWVVWSVAALFRLVVRLGCLDDLRALLPLLILSASARSGCRPEGVGGDLLGGCRCSDHLRRLGFPSFTAAGCCWLNMQICAFGQIANYCVKSGFFGGRRLRSCRLYGGGFTFPRASARAAGEVGVHSRSSS